MATLVLQRRNYTWKGYVEGAPEAPITVAIRRVQFRPVLDVRYDSDPLTPVANTFVSEARYGFTRYVVVEIP